VLHCAVKMLFSIGRFRYITWVKCPHRVADKAKALRAGKRASGRMPIQSCGQSLSAPRGKRYTEIGTLTPCLGGVEALHDGRESCLLPGLLTLVNCSAQRKHFLWDTSVYWVVSVTNKTQVQLRSGGVEAPGPEVDQVKLPQEQAAGLHSSTPQLNLSRFVTETTQRIPQKVLIWS